MKAELKDAWVKALRSGQYRQGTVALCQQPDSGQQLEYCCLGVLCEVLPGAERSSHGKLRAYRVAGRATSFSCLPPWLLQIVGLSSEHQNILIDLNDNDASFGTIAAYIEKYIPVTNSEDSNNG